VKDFFQNLLLDLLPFWQQLFSLIGVISWPLALILVAKTFRPLILHVLADRGISFEGFGAQLRIDARKASQIDSANIPDSTLSGARFKLPRTVAVEQREIVLREAIAQLPQAEVIDVAVNALAIEQLDKAFALAYIDIFGSQLVLLQRINERGGTISISDGEEFFSEVKFRFPEFSDWDFEKYTNFLVQRNLLRRSSSVDLTDLGKDFIHFVIRFGLRTDKPL
jgi:hypothetical protein